MNFRVTFYAGERILLERIDEEKGIKILVSAYMDDDHRFDDWIDCESVAEVHARIAEFSNEQAHEFLEKALAWYNSKFPVKHLDDLTHK